MKVTTHRELDALVAELIMGCRVRFADCECEEWAEGEPLCACRGSIHGRAPGFMEALADYSTTGDGMLAVIKAMARWRLFPACVGLSAGFVRGDGRWHDVLGKTLVKEAAMLPQAYSLAALTAFGHPVEWSPEA